jgi:hypothetical protein
VRRLRGEASELLQLPPVGIVFGCVHTLDGLGTFQNGRHKFVSMNNFWIHDVFVLEVDGIGKSFAPRYFDIAIVCAVMFFGRKEIPAIDLMVMPGTEVVGLLVYLCRTTHWSERHFFVVKRPAEMRVCRNSRGCI